MSTTTNAAIYEPTKDEIAKRREELQAEESKFDAEYAKRVSEYDAKNDLIIEAAKKQKDAKHADYMSARQPGNHQPIESNEDWAQKYERVHNDDKSVSYLKQGVEVIRDSGSTIGVDAGNAEALKDATALAKQRFGEEFTISASSPERETAMMTEMARQGCRPANKDPELQQRFAEVVKGLAHEKAKDNPQMDAFLKDLDRSKARDALVEANKEKEQQQEREGPEL